MIYSRVSLQDKKLRCAVGGLAALIFFALGIGVTGAIAQQKSAMPNVTSASVAFYPRISQLAHVEGVVKLRISTDGSRASSIEIESGPPMLAQAAEENIKTWRFDKHDPTTFETTFRYRLLPSKCDSKCNCDSVEKGSVHLQLPTNVEISAKEIMVCDPAEEIKH
jgi:Gram-negative bacterial TonB protein C-terminal